VGPHSPTNRKETQSEMPSAFLLDGYVDEPACFGVPPYISPYVRALAGVLWERGLEVISRTIDQVRRASRSELPDLWESADLIVVVAGTTVPGRYRGGKPLSLEELLALASRRRRGALLVGGAIHRGYAPEGGTVARRFEPRGIDCLATGDPEAVLDRFLRTGEWDPEVRRTPEEATRWLVSGAPVVRQRPDHPDLIAELELSRGCDREEGRCSYCTEGLTHYEERTAEQIVREVEALAREGIRAFRLGRCANLLSWGGKRTASGRRPNPEALRGLYEGIRSACPDLEMLHGDNGNPLTLVRFPEEAGEGLEAIVRGGTEGDGLSLGLESLDPETMRINRLKVTAEEALRAIRLVNRVGGIRKRPRGLPALLPGLNFLVGLAGQGREAFETNRRFLERLLEEDLTVRRVNIRQAMVFPDTPLASLRESCPPRFRDRDFRRFKEWIREDFDREMLRRVAPAGTIVRGVRIEERTGKIAFGRPLGSYPPLVGLVDPDLSPGQRVDAAVVDQGGRSLTAVPFPLDPNGARAETLAALPGIGTRRARRIVGGRPYPDATSLRLVLDDPGLWERIALFFSEGKRPESPPGERDIPGGDLPSRTDGVGIGDGQAYCWAGSGRRPKATIGP